VVSEQRIMPDRRFELVISLAALVLLLLGCAVVLRPFVTALLWAVVLWLTTAPIHQQVLSWVGERRTIAAALMTLGVSSVLLLPIVIVVISVAGSAQELLNATQGWLDRDLPQPPTWLASLPIIGPSVAERWVALAGDRQLLAEQASHWIGMATSSILTGGFALGRG
jgi:predicted PurR-regulated permease PerM